MMRPILAVFATLPLTTGFASAQTIQTLTDAGLGYPVPRPLESLTPIDGFRSHDSLRARLDEIWLARDPVERRRVGQSIAGRDIFAYRLTVVFYLMALDLWPLVRLFQVQSQRVINYFCCLEIEKSGYERYIPRIKNLQQVRLVSAVRCSSQALRRVR